MKNNIIFISLSILLVNCSNLVFDNHAPVIIKRTSSLYSMSDNSGEFSITRDIGLNKKKEFVVKSAVFPKNNLTAKPLEQSVTISSLGKLKNKTTVLRPKISNYAIWFSGKPERYYSELKINLQDKTLDLLMESPEKEWNGKRSIPFPKGTGVYCFFEQLMECIATTGFIQLAEKNESGVVNFHIIWEGYPYTQHQFSNMPDEVFTSASLNYNGKNDSNELKFTLNFNNNMITYFVSSRGALLKKFWVAQGLTMTKISDKNTKKEH